MTEAKPEVWPRVVTVAKHDWMETVIVQYTPTGQPQMMFNALRWLDERAKSALHRTR